MRAGNRFPHVPLNVGWNHVDDDGWTIECTCGAWFGPSIFMAQVGEDYDDHMREEGILIEE